MKLYLLMCALVLSISLQAQNNLGVFSTSEDIGNPKIKGSASYNSTEQSYAIKGAGYNVWFARDEFHYAYRKISGDFIITAEFELIGKGVTAHRKTGWMIRPSTGEDDMHITGTLHGDGLTVMQWRTAKGKEMRDPEDEFFSPKNNYSIIRMERTGKTISMLAAHPGEPLQLIGSYTPENLPDEVLVGVFVAAHNADALEEAKVWNVRIDKPVADDYNPNRTRFLGTRMEIVNVADGKRKIIHEHTGRFEAPNWMPDGKKLLFNQDGSLWTIPIEGGTPQKLNTDFADRNNNDHGISFDGKMLAISHHRQGLPGGGSTVYVLPLAGGALKQITEKTPSYWHGWSSDGKFVYYVAQREGSPSYNIYKAAVAGGDEIRLTNNINTHADGPEGSPDGKYIYYNANPTGTMQIWRMKPDGTGQQQLTFDEYNNWFPHISPDGKWMAIISFPATINPNDHPSYKRVMLRLMPLTQPGAPKVIAYLYGGQGTINVPSWSPDSKSLAFVSNSE
jgi:Tol biopolymer transport system component